MNKQLVVLLFISISISLIALISARTSDELRVTLPNGSKLVGRTLRSHDGRTIKSFLGVPYAKPPLGQLRFKVNFYDFFSHTNLTVLIFLSFVSYDSLNWISSTCLIQFFKKYNWFLLVSIKFKFEYESVTFFCLCMRMTCKVTSDSFCIVLFWNVRDKAKLFRSEIGEVIEGDLLVSIRKKEVIDHGNAQNSNDIQMNIGNVIIQSLVVSVIRHDFF